MKRQKRHSYTALEDEDDSYVPMQRIVQPPRFDHSIEAALQDGDTLQAIALRFHSTVAEIKRLNKIDKDNEIYARRTIKVPINPHSVLLEALPNVHKSGQSSPKRIEQELNGGTDDRRLESKRLKEKLMVASVVTSENSINSIILNSRVTPNHYTDDRRAGDKDILSENLLNDEIDVTMTHMRPIPGPSKNTFDCSGSDCDISWICLFICILALCFAIPLIYVVYIYEHPEKFHKLKNSTL